MKIEIREKEGKLLVFSPYHQNFIRRSHNLGGRWVEDTKAWEFDARDRERVRKCCLEVYGDDGTPQDKLYTMQAKSKIEIRVSRGSVYLGGYQIARAYDRDSGARLGEGVILLEGEIASGGSRNYWETIVREGSVIEIKDMTHLQTENAKKSAEEYEKWEILSVVGQKSVRRKQTKKMSAKKSISLPLMKSA